MANKDKADPECEITCQEMELISSLHLEQLTPQQICIRTGISQNAVEKVIAELDEEAESGTLDFLHWISLLDDLDPALLDELRERIQHHRDELEKKAKLTLELYEKTRELIFLELSQAYRSRRSAIRLPLRFEPAFSDATTESLDMLNHIMDGYKIYRQDSSKEDQ